MTRPSARAVAVALLLAALSVPLPAAAQTHYTNPIIFADYSDPDVVRVGDDYYLVASSFHAVPGLPILHSRDLVTWTILSYAAPRLPAPRYDTPRHGEGMWAPSLRFHEGAFWIYVGDPDLGIFMTRARDPRGPWEPLTLVKEARGWIDPCPLWDDDGSMYLVHAWAKSRVGFNSVLSVNRLSPDGRRVIDEGIAVFDGHANHPTMEGPKFYKRNGYYYIFAPAGGVKPGWQTVLRAKHVLGPYEDRTVLAQGRTPVNGPHQGAWVDTPAGESWFVHFQDRGAYGRIVHLQPVRWKDDWPVMGADPDGDGTGEPVITFKAPEVGNAGRLVARMPASDEFNGSAPGLQWQWQANPRAAWRSLIAKPGVLRLAAVARPQGAANLWPVPNLLLQKFPAESFVATARVDASALAAGERAGLAVMGLDYAVLTVSRTSDGWTVRSAVSARADSGAPERVTGEAASASAAVYLRVSVKPGAVAQFSWSADGLLYLSLGSVFTAREGRWVGAKVGLFAIADSQGAARGWLDIDWFRIDTGSAGRGPGSDAGVRREGIPARLPEDGARDVSLINAQLQWPVVAGAREYDIRVGTSDPPPLRGRQQGTTFAPGPLETATTYYWRIDAVTPSGTRPGPTWSFSTGGTVRIVLVGDSTVTDESGWGRGLLARVTSRVVLANHAKNGRSSKSYLAEGLWHGALGERADVMLIQFGHNDQPGKGPDRETDPATSFRANLAYYVSEARAAGAIPVIVTPLSRRQYDAGGRIVADLGPYAEAARAVARTEQAPLIDLNAASIDLLNRAGPAVGDSYGVVRSDGTLDRTHLSAEGSAVFGGLVADALIRVVPVAAPYLRPPAGQPARQPGPAATRGPVPWSRGLDQPDAWYGSADAVAVADTVLTYQRASGGWPKNIDMAVPLDAAARAKVVGERGTADATIDNGATTTQLRFLARVHAAAGQARFRDGFLSGFDYLLAAQYPNGGWPQVYPLRGDYSRRITFNDDAMVRVLEVLRDASEGRAGMGWVDQRRRERAAAAVVRGVSVILASQIRAGAKLTAWCAQVDEVTLEPQIARAYEHPSISGKESVGIVGFLMSIRKPAAAVVAAIDGAVAWFREVRIEGIAVVDRPDPALPGGRDRVVVRDAAAPALWARFYEIGTNRPIYSGRDSVIRYSLAEIEVERRVNYSWLGPYAADLLARDYPAWKSALESR